MEFTREEYTAFTQGDCGRLALAIHDITGWGIVTIGPLEDLDRWPHVAVAMPNGKILDIDGEWDRAQFEHYWYSDEWTYRIVERSIEWVREHILAQKQKYPQYDPAKYAQIVLDNLVGV